MGMHWTRGDHMGMHWINWVYTGNMGMHWPGGNHMGMHRPGVTTWVCTGQE